MQNTVDPCVINILGCKLIYISCYCKYLIFIFFRKEGVKADMASGENLGNSEEDNLPQDQATIEEEGDEEMEEESSSEEEESGEEDTGDSWEEEEDSEGEESVEGSGEEESGEEASGHDSGIVILHVLHSGNVLYLYPLNMSLFICRLE